MGQLQESFEQSQLVHDLKSRRVQRVAAKIPQKIGVLFQDKHRDAGPGQQKTQHHPGRSSTGNAALSRGGVRHYSSDMGRDMREEELYAEN
jgi:hypothetical protein